MIFIKSHAKSLRNYMRAMLAGVASLALTAGAFAQTNYDQRCNTPSFMADNKDRCVAACQDDAFRSRNRSGCIAVLTFKPRKPDTTPLPTEPVAQFPSCTKDVPSLVQTYASLQQKINNERSTYDDLRKRDPARTTKICDLSLDNVRADYKLSLEAGSKVDNVLKEFNDAEKCKEEVVKWINDLETGDLPPEVFRERKKNIEDNFEGVAKESANFRVAMEEVKKAERALSAIYTLYEKLCGRGNLGPAPSQGRPK